MHASLCMRDTMAIYYNVAAGTRHGSLCGQHGDGICISALSERRIDEDVLYTGYHS